MKYLGSDCESDCDSNLRKIERAVRELEVGSLKDEKWNGY